MQSSFGALGTQQKQPRQGLRGLGMAESSQGNEAGIWIWLFPWEKGFSHVKGILPALEGGFLKKRLSDFLDG